MSLTTPSTRADANRSTGRQPRTISGSSRRLGKARRALVAGTAALALLAAGCGAADETTTVDGGSESASGPKLESTVFQGEAMTISGETFDLGSLADKDLVVWFWAPW